jgi:hypothetical protein
MHIILASRETQCNFWPFLDSQLLHWIGMLCSWRSFIVQLLLLAANICGTHGIEVQFLHVGKCAGSTVEAVLRNLERPGGGKCLSVSPVHMNRPTGFGKKIVMSTRDPLDRVVSAFNYRHPYRGYTQLHNPPIPGQGHPWEVSFYKCFDRVNDFAEALSGTSPCSDGPLL